ARAKLVSAALTLRNAGLAAFAAAPDESGFPHRLRKLAPLLTAKAQAAFSRSCLSAGSLQTMPFSAPHANISSITSDISLTDKSEEERPQGTMPARWIAGRCLISCPTDSA